MDLNNLEEGTKVEARVDDKLTFIGRIRGYSSELPVLGKIYIVQVEEGVISEEWPYSSTVIPQCYLTVLK